jgi:hypothetical protein
MVRDTPLFNQVKYFFEDLLYSTGQTVSPLAMKLDLAIHGLRLLLLGPIAYPIALVLKFKRVSNLFIFSYLGTFLVYTK